MVDVHPYSPIVGNLRVKTVRPKEEKEVQIDVATGGNLS